MKITGIEIGEYRQFKNIKFDFTYPEDYHDKSKVGKPLEKVCFIGQSGTGKTTLLNVIWELISVVDEASHHPLSLIQAKIFKDSAPTNIKFPDSLHKVQFSLIADTLYVINAESILFQQEMDASIIDSINGISSSFRETNKLCLYLKDSISREADAFLADQRKLPETFNDFFKTTTQIEEDKATFQNRINQAGAAKTISLGEMKSLSIWQYLLSDLIGYDSETPKFMIELGQKAQIASTDAIKDLQNRLAQNPRVALQEECFKPLLDRLFLELAMAGEEGSYLALQTQERKTIPNNTLSTGTRQLLATAIPIYKFDTNGTVILFDEPERSLFPDIQRELVKYYTGLAPEAQFFFATHSPIIAAAFEPEERFILYFDENGEVNYRKGEAPIGDDPNDVLRKDFGMSPLVPEEGVEAYHTYLDLATKIKNESDIERRMELIAKRSILGNKYDFPATKTDEKN